MRYRIQDVTEYSILCVYICIFIFIKQEKNVRTIGWIQTIEFSQQFVEEFLANSYASNKRWRISTYPCVCVFEIY